MDCTGHATVRAGAQTHPDRGAKYVLVAWYDNEWGFSNRLAEVAAFIAGEI